MCSLLLLIFSLYRVSLACPFPVQSETLLQQIEQYLCDRKNTYYPYCFYEREITDLTQRALLLPELMQQYETGPYRLVVIEDFGNIVVITEDKIHYFFFKPIMIFQGIDSYSSRQVMAYQSWELSPELSRAVDTFKKTRLEISKKEKQGLFDEKDNPIRQFAWSNERRYRYLFLLWPTDQNHDDFLFEYNPCNPGMEGQPYYQCLMQLIGEIIIPWKNKYLLEHNVLPERERRFHTGTGGLACNRVWFNYKATKGQRCQVYLKQLSKSNEKKS